jgi:DNA-binding transcriptional LysR family regulator
MKKTFTIGSSTIPGEVILPHALPEILKRDSSFTFKIAVSNSYDTFEKVRRGEVEVGIIGTMYPSDEVDYQPVIHGDRLIVIAPKDHPASSIGQITLEELKRDPFINRENGSGTRTTYDRALQNAGLDPEELNVVAEISDTEGVIQAVAAGAGLAIVSEVAARQSECCGDLVILKLPFEINRDFYVITNKTSSSSFAKEVAQLLIDTIVDR